MTRNSTKELFTPFKESEQELQSSRKHLKTLSLDESRSPVFDLFYEIEENFEEEAVETIEETMEHEKELQSYTFSGSEHEDANDHIKKFLEIILDSKGVIPTKTTANAKIAIQEMAEYSQKWHNGTSRGSYGPQFLEANSLEALIIDNAIPPRREKDPGSFTLPSYINNACFYNGLVDLGASVSVMPLSTYLNLGLGELAHTKLIVELGDGTVKYPKGIAKNVLVGIGKFVFPVYFIILDMSEDIKVPLILRRPFLSTTHAKIDVFKQKITLRVRDEKIIFKSIKPTRSWIKRVYMIIERKELDLETKLMGETLMLNRSPNPLSGNYMELNDLNEPLELRRDQVEECEETYPPMDDLV
ncbi:reverse transcriptase domain-containing protein [Tanacetum coccineum]